jgi:DNA polymerase III subunit epsilon
VKRGPQAPRRSSRGHRWRDVEFAALDFETTGLDLQRDAVVSFGLVPVREGRIDLAGALYHEVSPDAPLSHRAVTVHHLRPADLSAAPPLSAVAEGLREGLDGKFLLTWSAEIEASFLSRTFGGSVRRWLNRSVDVLRLAILCDRIEGRGMPPGAYTLAEAVMRHGLPVEEAHHALNDALMTAEMFLLLAPRLRPFGFEDVRSFLRATRRSPDRILRRVALTRSSGP